MNNFKSIVTKLIESADRTEAIKNGATLLFEDGMDLRKHVLYKGLNEQEIQKMKDCYINTLPESWLDFWRVTNGADLFFAKIPYEDIELSVYQLSFYGLRGYGDDSQYKPYDITIEDLSKPDYCQEDWLKIGSFEVRSDLERVGLYMETINPNGKVYAYYSEWNELYKSWDSLEECVFDLINHFSKK